MLARHSTSSAASYNRREGRRKKRRKCGREEGWWRMEMVVVRYQDQVPSLTAAHSRLSNLDPPPQLSIFQVKSCSETPSSLHCHGAFCGGDGEEREGSSKHHSLVYVRRSLISSATSVSLPDLQRQRRTRYSLRGGSRSPKGTLKE
ncbi:hypothetical protein K1719_032602 [Acacia pycnantha]|nr:hypothetical protein K1719_032602 [Acacia pycnantha]